jgi:tetratricopeptide (TPR) repeat protein
MKAGAELARHYGFDSALDNSEATFSPSTPLPDIALYFGWYDQNVSGPFLSQLAEFRPGAVAYHLHSFSAKELRTINAGWAGPLLARGATATMGCTEEPYLQATPDLPVFISRFLYAGFTFGEAAYASQASLSWQITVVGDPLYRPFGKTQQERFNQLEARKDPLMEWSLLMWIEFRLRQGAPLAEIETFYKQTPLTKTNALLQAKLAEIYQSQGKIFAAVAPYEAALKLPASALEKLRISLNAGALFSSLGRAEQAYQIYKDLIENYPNYPGKKDLYERLSGVAEKLNKKDEATEYLRLSRES